MDFVQKSNFFLSAFFTEMISEKFFFRYCRKKRMILEEKIKVFKRAKRWTFSKGLVHGFCRKIELFLIGVFHRNHIRKNRFLYCRKKRMILKKKIEICKRAKKSTFSKGVSSWILSKNRNFSYRCFLQKLCDKKKIVFRYSG